MSNVTSFRSNRIKPSLLERGESPGAIAERDLARYYGLLANALRLVKLSRGEACFLIDSFNGVRIDDFSISPSDYLSIGVRDSIEINGWDTKWKIGGNELLSKISSWGELGCAAVLDAIERFWYEPDSYSIENIDEKLKKVGLL